MQPKIILSPAWAEREGMRDSDLASFFDIDLSVNELPAATAEGLCPQCGNPPADSFVQHFAGPPAATPEWVSGHVIVKCLCLTTYAFPYVHEVNAQQSLGHASVQAAQPQPVPPQPVPPLPSWTPVYQFGDERYHNDANAAVIDAHRQRRCMSPMLWEQLHLQQRSRVARTSGYRQNQASD